MLRPEAAHYNPDCTGALERRLVGTEEDWPYCLQAKGDEQPPQEARCHASAAYRRLGVWIIAGRMDKELATVLADNTRFRTFA
jgi:hypothetical protein